MLKQLLNPKQLLTIGCLLATTAGFTQSVDVGNIGEKFSKKNLIKIDGGVSANAILYSGNGGAIRNPFDYFVNGNVNVNLFNTINLPFSFNFTNTGHGFQYPTMPNRLSLHPRYKWVEGHIGDVNMTFSPYTLNGHQFTGAGFDFTPPGKLTGSVMYGRLQKAVAYDSANPSVLPTYKRTGYGAKLEYAGENYRVGFVTFAASDDVNSLPFKPDSLNVTPQKNLAVSWNLAYRPAANMELTAEYATSALTKDGRDTTKHGEGGKSYVGFLVKDNSTTTYYHALKANLNYRLKRSVIGVGYERVDPGYQTLGAYFFNNDLENITVNYTRPLLKDKANLAVNFGYQHDDLDGAKSGSNSRTVTAVNLSYAPSGRLNTALSYSNFTTHMFIKPQFQQINQLLPFQNLDTLNFSQLSQNANLNVNYRLAASETKTQNLNVNLSFFDAVDKQGGLVKSGNASQFYNLMAAYNLLFVPEGISITTALNASYNTVGKDDFVTAGPTLAANARLFKKQVTAGFSSSYNVSTASGVRQASVLNTRLNASYAYKQKHQLVFSLLHQARNLADRGRSEEVVATLGYNFRL